MPRPVPNLIDIETLSAPLAVPSVTCGGSWPSGGIPYVKVGHFIRFDPDEVHTWLDGQRVGVRGGPGGVVAVDRQPATGSLRERAEWPPHRGAERAGAKTAIAGTGGTGGP